MRGQLWKPCGIRVDLFMSGGFMRKEILFMQSLWVVHEQAMSEWFESKSTDLRTKSKKNKRVQCQPGNIKKKIKTKSNASNAKCVIMRERGEGNEAAEKSAEGPRPRSPIAIGLIGSWATYEWMPRYTTRELRSFLAWGAWWHFFTQNKRMGHACMAYHERVALLSLALGEHTAETPILRLSSVHW